MERHRNSLQPGYLLHWYRIEEILGQGGFGITYLAIDTNLNQKVAIKEYLPVEMAVREGNTSIYPVSSERGEQFKWGLDRFISEARTLAQFKHPNIVRVLTVFRENNTAYMVMEYEQGQPLNELIKDRKTLPEEDLKNILFPILDGLDAVHQAGFIHRDIKPPNIYIRENDSPVLIDFGSARQSLLEHTRTLTTMVSPGYAPFEQYVGKSDKQGPWSDIYGLGATLYRSVTGIAPPDSMDRSEAILHTGKDIFVTATEIAGDRYSPEFLSAIDQAMAFKTDDRPQSISAWREIFDGKAVPVIPDSEAATLEADQPTEKVDQPTIMDEPAGLAPANAGLSTSLVEKSYRFIKKLIKWLLILFAILLVFGMLSDHKKKKEQQEVSQVITDAPQLTDQHQVPPTVEPDETVEPEPVTARSARQAEIQSLIDAADQNISVLRLMTPREDNALDKYNRILEMDPGNRAALDGIDRIVDEYINLMDYAIGKGYLSRAEGFLSKAGRVNPQHPALGPARNRLQVARSAAASDVQEPPVQTDTVPESTDTARVVTIPEDELQQLRSIRERLRANPKDRKALRDLKELAQTFEENIRKAANAGDYDLARAYINEIQVNTDRNTRAYQRLQELLRVINEKEKQGGTN